MTTRKPHQRNFTSSLSTLGQRLEASLHRERADPIEPDRTKAKTATRSRQPA
ncbi:hypothetical protein IMZ48_16255 [Candidatus Bathyarchaeota archaeon]|nr:hypothetical protein [Candidatus Bathyarchaeota archaeon]